jgi:hypothetical protein
LSNWFTTNVRKIGDFFHNNFQVGFQANPFKYMGQNLRNTIAMQWDTKQHAKKQCKSKGMLQLGSTFLTYNKQNKSLGVSFEQGLN